MSKRNLLTTIVFLLLLSVTTSAQVYDSNLKVIIGDVKQRFIHNHITSFAQVDNLLDGLEQMELTGIRIPIFPPSHNHDLAIFDYFFWEAKARGFKIFANPARHSGGKRVAADSPLFGSTPNVYNQNSKTNNLINRIKAFAQSYPCDWITPFNEDGDVSTTNGWSKNQMNQIFAGLNNQVNGATLVGPCTWGIPAAISIANKTNIFNYATIATTHNLGFDHQDWPTYVQIARSKGIPIWDSETNYNDLHGTGTRIERAVDAGVDGLVIYNLGHMINLNNGQPNQEAMNFKAIYMRHLEPNPKAGRTYYITSTPHRTKLRSTSDNKATLGAPESKGTWVKWKIVNAGGGNVYLYNSENNNYLRADNKNRVNTEGGKGHWKKWKIVSLGGGKFRLRSVAHGKNLRAASNGSLSLTSGSGAWTHFYFSDLAHANTRGALATVEEENTIASLVENAKDDIKVYPNPAQDYLQVKSEMGAAIQGTLFTAQGKRVMDIQHARINIEALPKGMYYLRINGQVKSFLKL